MGGGGKGVCNNKLLVDMVVFTRSLELKKKEVMRRRSRGGLCTVMVHIICFVMRSCEKEEER